MGITKLQFIFGYSVFLLFVIQLSGMAGRTLFSDMPDLTIPEVPENTLAGNLVWFFANIGFFFSLMRISTEWFIFGIVVITPFVIGLIWSFIEIIKDLIPFT